METPSLRTQDYAQKPKCNCPFMNSTSVLQIGVRVQGQSSWRSKSPNHLTTVRSSVADPNPDPDPQDPYVLGTPGSVSFYHQSKIVKKTLISTVLSCGFCMTFYQ
jgi:hypothetical protein